MLCIQNICLWIDIKFIWLIFYIITGKGHLVQCFSTFYHIIRYSRIPNNFLQISLSSNLILLLSSKSRLVCPKWTRDKRMKDSTIHRRGSPNYRFFFYFYRFCILLFRECTCPPVYWFFWLTREYAWLYQSFTIVKCNTEVYYNSVMLVYYILYFPISIIYAGARQSKCHQKNGSNFNKIK